MTNAGESGITPSARSWLAPHAGIENGSEAVYGTPAIHAQEEHADYGNRRYAAQEDIPSR